MSSIRSIRSQLETALATDLSTAELEKLAVAEIPEPFAAPLLANGFRLHHGKVRDFLINDNKLVMFNSDRLSAFDRAIGLVPFKGVLLAAVTEYWQNRAASMIPVNASLRINERTFEVEYCQPIKVEVIVRRYLAGSMLATYEAGQREFCGYTLPEQLQKFRPLPELMITPTTKAEAFAHDENTSADLLISQGVCTSEEWQEICDYAKALFELGENELAKRGWILVDTKYEFGRDRHGKIKVIDEIHTPDSSRFWRKQSYENRLNRGLEPDMFDKQIVRQWLVEHGFNGQGPVPRVPPAKLIELALAYCEIAESLET